MHGLSLPSPCPSFNSFWLLHDLGFSLAAELRDAREARCSSTVLQKSHELPQNCSLERFGRPRCSPISSSARSAPEGRIHFRRCTELLQSPSPARAKAASRVVPLLLQVARSTGVVLPVPALQLGLASRGPRVGAVACTRSWAPQLCQHLAGCWSSSHSTGREQVPGTGGVRPAAASERVLFVKPT